jgi:hypothetical protein
MLLRIVVVVLLHVTAATFVVAARATGFFTFIPILVSVLIYDASANGSHTVIGTTCGITFYGCDIVGSVLGRNVERGVCTARQNRLAPLHLQASEVVRVLLMHRRKIRLAAHRRKNYPHRRALPLDLVVGHRRAALGRRRREGWRVAPFEHRLRPLCALSGPVVPVLALPEAAVPRSDWLQRYLRTTEATERRYGTAAARGRAHLLLPCILLLLTLAQAHGHVVADRHARDIGRRVKVPLVARQPIVLFPWGQQLLLLLLPQRLVGPMVVGARRNVLGASVAAVMFIVATLLVVVLLRLLLLGVPVVVRRGTPIESGGNITTGARSGKDSLMRLRTLRLRSRSRKMVVMLVLLLHYHGGRAASRIKGRSGARSLNNSCLLLLLLLQAVESADDHRVDLFMSGSGNTGAQKKLPRHPTAPGELVWRQLN